MPDIILAVDQGSSSSRCAALDLGLHPLGQASRPVSSTFPRSGWVEHDPAELLGSVLAVTADALGQARASWPDVAAIGLAAQTETFVVWERATGRPVYPAISWRDSRGAGRCAQLRADGHEPRIRGRTGLPLEAAFSAAKLGWLLDNIPAARRRAAAGQLLFGDVNCWLMWNLSGGAVHLTEPSMAARTMLFSLPAGAWDDALLELFGIPRPLLPEVTATAGKLAWTDPARCGGRALISASIGDQPAALFGHRCWQPGQAKLTLGTGAFLWCHAGARPPASVPPGVVASCAWQLPAGAGRGASSTAYALEGFVPNAGGVTAWLRRLGLLACGDWPLIRAGALQRIAAGDPVPWCVPALFGLGTPHWTAAPRADIVGLGADSTGADVAEAALIGVAQQIADAIDAVASGLSGPLELIRVDGGLGRNDSLLRAVADLTGCVLERNEVAEVTSLGAAALAGIGAGLWDQAALASLPAPAGTRLRPALGAAARTAARAAWQAVLAASVAGRTA